jgi:hypothetical protein
MCVGKPKAPKVQPIPDRVAARLPDQGDPGVRATSRTKRKLMPAAMIFTNQGTLGAPSVTSPGAAGY